MRMMAMGVIAAAAMVAGCSQYDQGPRFANNGWSQYDWNRPDPSYNGYDAARYYRDNPRARERRLAARDRVYVGQDGRYYCRRNDGTTGLIVGGIAGGVLGNIIAPGGSGLLGTVLGAAAGAAGGRAIDRNNVRCR